jgi:rifampicin phosphotransferase
MAAVSSSSLLEPGGHSYRADALIVRLEEVGRGDTSRVGGKAATLGELLQAGFCVPDGFVVTTHAFADWLESGAGQLSADLGAAIESAVAGLGGTLAVRSSGVAEDSVDASYAGLYETYLGVEGVAGVKTAVRSCFASVSSSRVDAYQTGRGDAMAVLVQRQVAPDVAGVAFTANPVTGARDEALIDAVRGLADRLVSGESDPDRWVVREGKAQLVSVGDGSLDARRALQVHGVATSIERLLGGPQDIEWAISGGEIHVLQARPITALPEPVDWTTPKPGAWIRNFRLGEWIGEPVTPLFDTWLLTRLEEALYDQYLEWFGFGVPKPHHVTVNGWYYSTLPLPTTVSQWAKMIFGVLVRLGRHPRRTSVAFPPLAGFGVEIYLEEWRGQTLPRYQALVKMAESRLELAAPERIIEVIDEMADMAGRYFASLTVVAGYGWKTELPLAEFYNEHLGGTIGGSHQTLLSGLSTRAVIPPHSVQSLDWHRATLGELRGEVPDSPDARFEKVRRRRIECEEAARVALKGRTKLETRFEELLTRAQEAARAREEHVSHFTLAWPVMRAGAMRIGSVVRAMGLLSEDKDVFFLTREEMVSLLGDSALAPLTATVDDRRQTWERQRRLRPPDVIGQIPRPIRSMFAKANNARSGVVTEGAIVGHPASPGRISGVARVIRDLGDSDRLGEGEILVAPLTTPAWTPLFRWAAAVVTDVGSVVSHASLLAREYGIPAVVGTGTGTSRIRDGAVITVDGSGGYVQTQVG